MRPPIRALMLAALVGIVATLLAPASPAHAVDCIEEFVIDPTLCDDPIDPGPEPPPEYPPADQPPNPYPPPYPPPPPPRVVSFSLEELSRNLVPLPSGPGEVCQRFDYATGAGGIDTAGRKQALYGFTASISFCITTDIGGVRIVTKPVLGGRNQKASATDNRLSLTPVRQALLTGDGTSRVLAVAEMFFRFCEGVEDTCSTARHFIQFIVTPSTITPSSQIEQPFDGPLPIFT